MKVLLLRIGRLGDMVMILPALNEIRRQYPNAELHAITSSDGVTLLKLAGLRRENLVLYRTPLVYRLLDQWRIRRYLRRCKFDKIFCFESKKRHVSWLPVNTEVLAPPLGMDHYAARCLQLVNQQVSAVPPSRYLSTNPNKVIELTSLLRPHQINAETILIGFHPTYSGFGKFNRQKEHRHRLWPWQYYSELAIKLAEYGRAQRLDVKVIIDLLPEEQPFGHKITQHSQGNVILLSSSPNLERYLCFLQRLNCLIVANTGVMHLAAAVNTPMIALFSGMHPDECGPYMSNERFTVLRAETTSKPDQGLASISVTEVFNHTIQLLAQVKPLND